MTDEPEFDEEFARRLLSIHDSDECKKRRAELWQKLLAIADDAKTGRITPDEAITRMEALSE